MAQAIRCDYTGCPDLADVIVSNLQNGDTIAWCGPHYIEQAVAIAQATAGAEADQAAAEANARLEAAGQAPTEPAQDQDQAIDTEPAQDQDQAIDTEPARTVRRGHSRSRVAHESRERARATVEDGGELVVVPAAGPDDDDDEDDTDANDAPTP